MKRYVTGAILVGLLGAMCFGATGESATSNAVVDPTSAKSDRCGARSGRCGAPVLTPTFGPVLLPQGGKSRVETVKAEAPARQSEMQAPAATAQEESLGDAARRYRLEKHPRAWVAMKDE